MRGVVKRSHANAVANPMLVTEEVVWEGDGGELGPAAERALQMVRDRDGKRPESASHLLDTAMDNHVKHAGADSDEADPYAPVAVTATAKARAKFESFVKQSMLEKVVFGKREAEAEAELLKALWKGEAQHKVQHPGGLWTGLLYPESGKRLAYDLGQLGAVLYTACVVPLRLAFDETPEVGSAPFYFDVAIDCFFIFDIFLSFHAYTRDEHTGRLETDRKVLRSNYLTGFFALDAVACFPFDYIMLMTGKLEEAEGARNLRLLRLIRMSRALRLTKLLRLFKASRMRAISDFIHLRVVTNLTYRLTFEVTFLAGVIFAVAHIIGCLWLHIGIVNAGILPHGSWVDHRGWYKPDSVCSPEYESNPQEGLDTIVLGSDDPSFDVLRECLDSARISQVHIYIEAIYFIVVTMSSVGYGDISPRSSSEKAFVTVVIVIGGFLWAFVIAMFSDMINGMTEAQREYDNKLRKVTSMLTFLGAEKEFKDTATKFYQFRFKKRRFFEDGMSNELPPRLRREFIALRFSEALYKVPFFRNVKDETLIRLCSCMQSFGAPQGEIIIEEDDSDRDLFIVELGGCEAFIGDSIEPAEFFPEGAFFGEMSFFGLATKRSATVITTTYSELSWISYQDFSEVLDGDIDLRRRMFDFAKLRQEVYQIDQAELEIEADIKSIDEAEKTAKAAAIQAKITTVYQRIQAASAKEMAAESSTTNRNAMSEAEQTQLRLFQVETSVLRIHELCHQMASKVGVDASAVEKLKPTFVPGHNQDCL